jgi:hypothetical protein
MEETLDERRRMDTGSHDVKAAKHEHPLIVTGVILAVLLATLLALPFVAHVMHGQAKPISLTPGNGVTPTSPAQARVRDF